jgi:hypothetical protein
MIAPGMEVNREIVIDLWPGYVAGTLSPGTRALLETYLAQDPELARRLREPERPDEEQGNRPLYLSLLLLAMLFSCFALGRIVSDTSWDVPPIGFAITAGIAGLLWIAFLVALTRTTRTRRVPVRR